MKNENLPYTVLIADDHDGVRKGIRRIIEGGQHFRVVAEARDGKEAVELADQIIPDLIILDVKLPLLRGDDVARQLNTSHPEIKILALSSFDNPEYVSRMIENGASGYLTKDEAPLLLRKAAIDILEERSDCWLSENLVEHTGIHQPVTPCDVTLTRTELEVLHMLKDGKEQEEIANELGFSLRRLNKYLQVLQLKFEVDSLSELL